MDYRKMKTASVVSLIKESADRIEAARTEEEKKRDARRQAEVQRSIDEVAESLSLWGNETLPPYEELVEALDALGDAVENFREDPLGFLMLDDVGVGSRRALFERVLQYVGCADDVRAYLDLVSSDNAPPFDRFELESEGVAGKLGMAILAAHPSTRDVYAKRRQAYYDSEREAFLAIPEDDQVALAHWGDRRHAEDCGCLDVWDRREVAYKAKQEAMIAAAVENSGENKRIIEQVKPAVLTAIFECLGPGSAHWESMKLAQAEGLLHREEVIELLWQAVFGPVYSGQHVSSDRPDHVVFGPQETIRSVGQISVKAYERLQSMRDAVARMLDPANRACESIDLKACIGDTSPNLTTLGRQAMFAAVNAKVKIVRPYEVEWRYERVTNQGSGPYRAATTAVCSVTLVRAITIEARFVLEAL